MLGWIVGIYLVLGIALAVSCELMKVFDQCIEDTEKLYDLTLGSISRMFIKGLLQFIYVALWWVVVIITVIYVFNNR